MPMKCDACDGTGKWYNGAIICPMCGGAGQLHTSDEMLAVVRARLAAERRVSRAARAAMLVEIALLIAMVASLVWTIVAQIAAR